MAQIEASGDLRAPIHLTTRRGFIFGCGFGVLSLYGLWAAYGAAPIPFLGAEDHDAGEHKEDPAGGHAGHGASALGPDAFRALTEDFIAAFGEADGSVRPVRIEAGQGEHAGHVMPAEAPVASAAPVDLYLMAERYGYVPGVLHLQRGERYRLRVMAMDTAHGASIALRPGARIIRAPALTLVETPLAFSRAGEYLVYCTVFCGDGHDRMAGRILVA